MGYITAGDDNSSDLSAIAFSIMTPCYKNGDLYLWYVSNIKGSLKSGKDNTGGAAVKHYFK